MKRVVEHWKSWAAFVRNPRYIEHRRLEGWREALPFYRAYCKEHGWYEDYPHGDPPYLLCPICARRGYYER